MGLQYSGDDLNTLKESIINSMGEMNEMSGSIILKAMAAFQDPSWTGQTASRFSSYFEMVYQPAVAELCMLNTCLRTYLNTYYVNYTGYVDTDHHAVIYTAETDQLSEDLTGRDTAAVTIHTAVETQINSVSDLTCAIVFNDPEISESIQSVLKEIQDMYNRIDATESTMAADMSEFASACSDLSELMRIGVSATVSADGKTLQFDEQALKGALEKVSAHYNNQSKWMEDNIERVLLAEQVAEADRVSRRGEEAGTVKIIVGIFCAIGSVIVTVATGGAAAPIILCGAASGALVNGVNNAADQYTEKGWDGICWLEVGEDACIGFVVGGATSATGYGLSAVATTATSAIPVVQIGMHSGKAAQMLTYGAVGTGSSMLSGIGSRAVGNATYQLLKTGKIDGEAVAASSFSTSGMIIDGVIGGTAGLYTGYHRSHEFPVVKDEFAVKDSEGNYKYDQYRQRQAKWAPGDGYERDPITGQEIKSITFLSKGKKLQRFGTGYGKYFTDPGTLYEQCALPYEEGTAYKHDYEARRGVLAETGTIGPQDFGPQGVGGGPQYKITLDGGISFENANDLIKNGYMIETTIPSTGFYGSSAGGIHTVEVLNGDN